MTADRGPPENTTPEADGLRSIRSSTGEDDPWATVAPSEPRFSVPQIGKYTIVKDLKPGGQAAPLVAIDTDLKRHVVLKRYHRRAVGDNRATVAREGQALVRARSPHLAQCYGMERVEDDWFLVLEFIPGHNLAEARRNLKPDFDTAARWITQVADGLSAIHACGLLHRDIKPENIIVGEDGVVRLVDFGLAAAIGSDSLRDLSGTPSYMAPEQARREWERIDPRSDVFGLGAVLYGLLTGRPPYQGRNVVETLEKAQDGRIVPPRQVNSKIPKALESICLKAMATASENRYGNAREFGEALRRWLDRKRRAAAILGSIALMVVLSAAGTGLAWNAIRRTSEDTSPRPGAALEPPSPAPPAEPLQVVAFQVTHNPIVLTAEGKMGRRRARDLRTGSEPVRELDKMRVAFRLNAPAYCFLFGYNADGKPQLCHPASDQEPPTPVSEVDYPLKLEQGYSLSEGPGLQAFILVAASEPLPSFARWRHFMDDVAWPRAPAAKAHFDVDAWQYDGEHFVPLDSARGPIEDLGEAPDAFKALCERVRRQPGVAAVKAIAFPVSPRDDAKHPND